MIDPNRPNRLPQVTPATDETNERLAPVAPAQGAVLPTGRGNLVLALVVLALGGGLAAAIPFASGPAMIALVVASGAVNAIGAGLGIMSAGFRK